MPVTKACEQCGSEFSVRPAKAYQRFCSLACQKTKRDAAHAEKICEECGASFVVTRKRELSRRFCSKQCTSRHEAVHGRPAAQVVPVELHCRECGRPFFYRAALIAEYERKYGKKPPYCSKECSAIGRKKDADERHTMECQICGTTFTRSRRGGGHINREQNFCSPKCRYEAVSRTYRRNNGPAKITKSGKRGYVWLHVPAELSPDGATFDILEHRYVMEQILGRKLSPEETVHHRSGDKTDNSPENLQLFAKNHGPGQLVEDIITWCVTMFRRYPEFAKAAGVALIDVAPEPHVTAVPALPHERR